MKWLMFLGPLLSLLAKYMIKKPEKCTGTADLPRPSERGALQPTCRAEGLRL